MPRWWLPAALVIGGTLLLVLSATVSGLDPRGDLIAFRFGHVLGALIVWPALLIGLFAIGRRFRTPRARGIIVLVAWSLSFLGELGQLDKHRKQARGGQLKGGASTASAPAEEVSAPSESTVPRASPPSPPAAVSAPAHEFDFSRGSDERLAQLVESASTAQYRQVAAAYARACNLHPTDARLALERVKFIERFAYAEDFSIPDAEPDLEVADHELTARFSNAPGTVLHRLAKTFGPEFQTQAALHAGRAESWPAEERARFFLLRAQRTEDQMAVRGFAERSFNAHATIEAGLLLLKAAGNSRRYEFGLQLLEHPVFRSGSPWQRKQQMIFLFDAGQPARALAVYDQIKTEAPGLVRDLETATRLAGIGRGDEARALFTLLGTQNWNREQVCRARFKFELQYGGPKETIAAYRALRATGLRADPVLRDRFTLLRKYPRAGWSAQDAQGALVFIFTLATMLLLPAVVLVPVHYWSLLRARRGTTCAWPGARWNLRHAWIITGLLFSAQFAAFWWFQPELLRSWFTAESARTAVNVTDGALLRTQCFSWAAMLVILGLAVGRARAWRLFGPGHWKAGQVATISLGSFLALRIFLSAYAVLWPGAVASELAGVSLTRQLALAILHGTGPVGLILAFAVMVPVLEELLFRGIFLQSLARHIPFGWANFIQALLFALSHENLRLLPFFVAFGLAGGLLARRSGGLLSSLIVHAANNLIVCAVLLATKH